MSTSTGCPQLDRMLRGGIPDQRAVLVTGGPGVGKSTLAMQFLQDGLEKDEECLYISTEQTTEELRSSFGPFEFDLDHPNLTITSIHATPTSTIEESESGLALKTLRGDETIDGPFTYPFEGEYIIDFLQQYAPCDRIVLDSVSGLGALASEQHRFRRVILDLIRLFTDTFRATTLLTAEEVSAPLTEHGSLSSVSSDLLQFTTNGVVRLWWGELRGTRRRFLQVVKMRGVDHDTRSYELGFDSRGVYLTPNQRTAGYGIHDQAIISTGIEGLDEISGGGLVRGHSILLEYDGRALIDNIVANISGGALDSGMAVWLITSPILSADRFSRLLPGDYDIERLLDENRLFVLDGFSAWQSHDDHRNVFTSPGGLIGNMFRKSTTISMYLMKKIANTVGRRRDAPLLGTTYTEAFLRWLEPSEVKEVYYWAREELAREHDTGFFIHNPATMQQELAEFFHSDAVQVFETIMEENGIQYINLNKSPIGQPGSTKVLDYTHDGLVVHSGE